ncbi:unnamed protein product [Caenorhabditis nigoni]|uniref:Uncharacterized protein n=1 Tax=Caenorhabditis nigoni TaxID=1611254 RepID=A0A2G5V5U1_9PELO|nr:hypothetical protein B9Z55_006609 [Caenorhabditis nigoni]
MPPRRIKKEKDAEAARIAEAINEPMQIAIEELRKNLLKNARETARAETARILSLIPKEYHDMPISEFLLSPPEGIFDGLKAVKLEEMEEEQPQTTAEDGRDDMEVDDAAHETSIPIAPSGQNSGRNTAADAHRNEIITPAGVAFPLPVLHPNKPFRHVQATDEIGFSLNGSPLFLASNKKKTTKKSKADACLLEPKTENLGTSV